jgi:hypothetical protein
MISKYYELDTTSIQRKADALGVTLKFGTETKRLQALRDHADSYRTPAPRPLTELVLNTAPDDWDAALAAYSAADNLPRPAAIRNATEKAIYPALTSAIKSESDAIVKQLHGAAIKAADALNAAAQAGITNLGDYEFALKNNLGPLLMDATTATKQLNAYAEIICTLADVLQDGTVSLAVAALIATPDNLAPLPISVKYTDGADVRYAAAATKKLATPDAEQAWENNGALRTADSTTRLLDVANGVYNGFTLAPAATITEAMNRAEHINNSLGSDVVNPAQRPDRI